MTAPGLPQIPGSMFPDTHLKTNTQVYPVPFQTIKKAGEITVTGPI